MSHVTMGRVLGAVPFMPRKRVTVCLVVLVLVAFTTLIINTSNSRLQREEAMEQQVAEMQSHLLYLQSQYRGRQEDIMSLHAKLLLANIDNTPLKAHDPVPMTPLSPKVTALLKNMSGTQAAAGMSPKPLPQLRTPFVFQLLPHLMNDPASLRPAYHMKAGRTFVDVVIGIPTVKRDKDSYLMITLKYLIDGLAPIDLKSTLIVVMVGELDLEYVLKTARQIEVLFPNQTKTGLIEVISPSNSYYPNLETLPSTLGDSHKRVMWRTKQNLDAIFLMAYAQSKGTFYLMMEDDVIAKPNYMQNIKKFAASTTVSNPQWFFIEYCQMGGIGKLFKSSDLIHFITYVQLFYNNMPIDWLLESYLADRVCTIDKNNKVCGKNKLQIRPKYKLSLFQHIGIYSSLKGKIQKIKDPNFGPIPTYSPQEAPPPERLRVDVEINTNHTLKKVYQGQTFFWGMKPKKGDTVEFWFENPTEIEKFTFWNGKDEQSSDKINNTVVEILPFGKEFDSFRPVKNFGVADGETEHDIGPLDAIRLRVTNESFHWIVLSEGKGDFCQMTEDDTATKNLVQKACGKSKLQIRPKYRTSLFQHIGLYSSLKGKIQKIKDSHFGSIPMFYPHDNPPVKRVHTNIAVHTDHTLKKAYDGLGFFWGVKPRKGSVVEFWFKKPTAIEKFIFRTSNIEHMSDKFYDTVVEILPASNNSIFTIVDSFDEFGLAEEELKREIGPLAAIRLRVTKDSLYWVVLSEIFLKPFDDAQMN